MNSLYFESVCIHIFQNTGIECKYHTFRSPEILSYKEYLKWRCLGSYCLTSVYNLGLYCGFLWEGCRRQVSATLRWDISNNFIIAHRMQCVSCRRAQALSCSHSWESLKELINLSLSGFHPQKLRLVWDFF